MAQRLSNKKQEGIIKTGGIVFLLLVFLALFLAVPVSGRGMENTPEASVGVELDGDVLDRPVDTVTGEGDSSSSVADDEFAEVDDEWLDDDNFAEVVVSDPLEPMNRMFFGFNDKLYFWFMKPLARVYGLVLPKPVRKGIANVFRNLGTPVRLVNCLFQGKLASSGSELTRFAINSTVGVAGLWDPARDWFNLKPKEEDLGQTLGKYGIGEGFYICLPFFGPSNIRDSVGLAGDYFLDPVSWATLSGDRATRDAAIAAGSTDKVNNVSLRIGDYEDFKKATFDPYSAMRDAYALQRRGKIKD